MPRWTRSPAEVRANEDDTNLREYARVKPGAGSTLGTTGKHPLVSSAVLLELIRSDRRVSTNQGEGTVKHAIVSQGRGNHANVRPGPARNLTPQLLAQRHKEGIPSVGDAAADHNSSRIQKHDGGLQAAGEIHDMLAYEGRVGEQFLGRPAVVLFEPKAATEAFQAAVRPAQTKRTIGPDRQVADLAGVGISTAVDRPIV